MDFTNKTLKKIQSYNSKSYSIDDYGNKSTTKLKKKSLEKKRKKIPINPKHKFKFPKDSKSISNFLKGNYLDLSYEQSNIDIHPEPLPMRHSNSLESFSHLDNRLVYVLYTLGLNNLIGDFTKNMINFTDLLLLSKEDLEELKLPFGPKNRILKFSEKYKKTAKDYDLDELKEFFANNRNMVNKEVNEKEYDMQNSFKKSSKFLSDSVSEIKKLKEDSIEDMEIADKEIQNDINKDNNTIQIMYNNLGEYYVLPTQNIEIPEISDYEIENNFRTNISPISQTKSTVKIKEEANFKKKFSKPKSKPQCTLSKTSASFNKLSKPFSSNKTFSNGFNPRNTTPTVKTVFKSTNINRFKTEGRLAKQEPKTRKSYSRPFQGRKEKIFQEYKSLFAEIANFQKSYNTMKMRSDERNIRINNLLCRKEKVSNPIPFENQEYRMSSNTLAGKERPALDTSHNNLQEYSEFEINKNRYQISGSDANEIESINEILAKKKVINSYTNDGSRTCQSKGNFSSENEV